MLDDQTVRVVRATAPVLQQHGLAIVQRMYALLFAAEPSIQALFNPANQRPSRQHGALAHAVWAYAANIHNPSVLFPAIELINHKHIAHRVRPEHYPLVGKYLLQAIQDVLGEAATPQIIEAWGRAYRFLADLLIANEEALTAKLAEQPGGWTGLRSFLVVGKVVESDEISSFYLQPADGAPLPLYRPGQYVPVRIRTALHPDGVMRCYSLSCRPGLHHWRITVKREPEGEASNHLHATTRVGDTLELGVPCGNFSLQYSDRPLLLLSGGVGQTPMVSMLEHALHAQQPRPIWFVHAARNGRVHALRHHVAHIAATNPQVQLLTAYDSPTPEDRQGRDYDMRGYVSEDALARIVAQVPGVEAYVCGPRPFLSAMLRGLSAAGVPEGSIHHEFFGPAAGLGG